MSWREFPKTNLLIRRTDESFTRESYNDLGALIRTVSLSFTINVGAGASAENARSTVSSMLMNKPEDASDITDLEKAKAEIIQLRKMAKLYHDHLGTCHIG